MKVQWTTRLDATLLGILAIGFVLSVAAITFLLIH